MYISSTEKYYSKAILIVKSISILIIFSILFDSIYYLQEEGSSNAIIRGIIFYLFILYILVLKLKVKITILSASIFLLITYWLLLVPFSSNVNLSLNTYSKVIIPFLLLLITSNLPPNSIYFRYLFFSFATVIVITIFYAILSNLFNIGNASYAKNVESFVRVGLGDGKLYAQAVATIFLPFVWYNFKLSKKNKIIIILLIFSSIIFSIISVRRTTLIIIFGGTLLFFIFSNRIKNVFTVLPRIALVILLSSPLWYQSFVSRMSLRESTFSADYDIKEEARYMEIPFVLKETLFDSNVSRFLFGKELFNSAGNYADGIFKERRLHIDYMNILHGSGVVGIVLYLLIYYSLAKYFNIIYANNHTLSLESRSNLRGLFYSFYYISLIISISGQMYEITFRVMIFVVLGIVLARLKNNNYEYY